MHADTKISFHARKTFSVKHWFCQTLIMGLVNDDHAEKLITSHYSEYILF